MSHKQGFNWNYATAHTLGQSRVRDEIYEAIARQYGEPSPLERRITASEYAHRDEVASARNPYMLENCHA